jgi:hypothetical protein
MILGHHDGKRLWTGAQADVDSTLTSPRWRLSNSRYAMPFSLNFSEFVDGRSASVMCGVHFQETLLVARDGLENSAEIHRTSASVDALQTAIN